ncbi:FAD-dependent oxidoreductase [Dehalobacter sp. DCM]|uniref:FAD-dependent oxidoreductase n=1 Tax=Dehalobacter sp. DCM TaxID=2907827 RepID=UPI0030812A45|nr:FAD-dependent oxidoreductase [Dehalobacter sp. DCM]
MRPDKDFDVIIIGAGPAGSACAYTLAKQGKDVMLIERGDFPGSKNMTGGRIYSYALEQLEPGLTASTDLERCVVHEQVMVMAGGRSIMLDYHDPLFNPENGVPQSYTVLRSKFDRWLANKAESAGVNIVCGIRVDDVIKENGDIIGVIAGDDKMICDLVIAADGVNSLMAQKAGLIGDIRAGSMGLGIKETIELPSEIINQRFNLKENEGTARMILGCTDGIRGGAFLYTNNDSISLGAVYSPEDIQKCGKPAHRLFQELKMHPAIYPLITDGRTVEYAAHLVGEGGYKARIAKPYQNGLLVIGDAAGFVMNMGYTVRGLDLAILSGIAAADAYLSEQDSRKTGPVYVSELEKALLPAMRAVEKYHQVMQNSSLYTEYPQMAVSLMTGIYTVDAPGTASLKTLTKQTLKANHFSWRKAAKAIWTVVKSS